MFNSANFILLGLYWLLRKEFVSTLNVVVNGKFCSVISGIHFRFSWVLPFFKTGYKKDLEVKDIYNSTRPDLSGPLGDALERYQLFV